MLEHADIEAVSICTWNDSHAEIVIAALRANKHVLVEKPLCITLEEAYRVEEAASQSNKVMQVGFVRRFSQITQILKTFIDAGELGPIYYAKASCLRRVGNPGGWFSDSRRSGGGPLIDLGVHIIDLCWFLMGCPQVASVSGNVYKKLGNRANIEHLSIYKSADYDPELNDVEDLANALIRFTNGASLMIDTSFSLHARKDEIAVKVYGEKGGAEIEPELLIVGEKYNTILNMTPQAARLSFDFQSSFQNEIDGFIECCLTGKAPISTVRDGVELMKIVCGIYESARTGKEIMIGKVPSEIAR